MKNLVEHLSSYAAYHRDARNVVTHFVGIPMIVVGVSALLARPSFLVAGLPLSPSLLLAAAVGAFYLALDLRYGLVLAALLGLSAWAGASLAAAPTGAWLLSSLGLFAVGWAFQFVGHYFEGKKPAFVDDLVGLLQGPLFLVAEASFAFGLRADVHAAVEARFAPAPADAPHARVA